MGPCNCLWTLSFKECIQFNRDLPVMRCLSMSCKVSSFVVKNYLKAVYYTVCKKKLGTSTVEVTTTFVEKFKAHFEKKLLN